jgi:DNA-binding LacI/PurR family transcriptional regulator
MRVKPNLLDVGNMTKFAKTTMADVAERAGVSPATVARVLYANGYVSAEKRAIVRAALEATGYRPNVMARALRTAKSFTLGMVVSESRLNAFHSSVARAVQAEALKHGYTVLTLNNGGSQEIERQGVQRFLDQHVDAVIFCAALDPDNVRVIAESGTSLVQIERQSAKVGSFSLVDPAPGMADAVEHLRELGHARIAYIGGKPPPWRLASPRAKSVETQRAECFRRSMKSAGLDASHDFVRLGLYCTNGADHQPGLTMMHEVLALREKPTAVIVGSDLLAAGALQALHESGVRVPDDMSVIGYDDTLAEILTPPLTTIAQPIVELGRNAVILALEAIASPGALARRIVAPTRLVVRHSSARPR